MSTLPTVEFLIRKECPAGACVCDRENLLAATDGDVRILRLTQAEEKKLIARIDAVASYAELKHLQERMHAQLGMVLRIVPGTREVRTVRGLRIELADQAGLCRKTRQAIPTAVRRCLEQHPEIVYALLDAHDLFGAPSTQ